VIEPKLAFFQVQIESVLLPSMKLLQSVLRIRPEAFYAIDMILAPGKLIGSMMNPIVLFITQIH
jgi:hypothetical protein